MATLIISPTARQDLADIFDYIARDKPIAAGSGRVGTLYSVYDMLHRLSCRWFGPGPLHEEIPSASWEPEFDVSERPDFRTRGFFSDGDRGDPDFLLWMARNRLNEWTVAHSNHPLMRKLGIRMVCGGHDAQWFFLKPIAPYAYDHPSFEGDEKNPKDPYLLHASYGQGRFCERG